MRTTYVSPEEFCRLVQSAKMVDEALGTTPRPEYRGIGRLVRASPITGFIREEILVDWEKVAGQTPAD